MVYYSEYIKANGCNSDKARCTILRLLTQISNSLISFVSKNAENMKSVYTLSHSLPL